MAIQKEVLRKRLTRACIEKQMSGAVALSNQCEAPFQCKKITARPRKNPAVSVKYKYVTTYTFT